MISWMTKMSFYVRDIVTDTSSSGEKKCNTFIPLAEYKSSFMCDLGGEGEIEIRFFELHWVVSSERM